jgi:HEAT repeat protein
MKQRAANGQEIEGETGRLLVMKRVVEILLWLAAVAIFAFAGRAVFAGVRQERHPAQPAKTETEQGAKPAASSIPSLIEKLKSEDEDERDQAASDLAQIGEAAVPALTEFLNNEKGAGRASAASALAEIEPKNKLALQVLTEIARGGKGDEVIEAAESLADVDPDSDVAVPHLVKMASKTIIIPSRKSIMRERRAAFALAMTAPGVRALTQLLKHWDPWVREAAVFAFDDRTETLHDAAPSIQAAVKDAIPALVSVLADKDKIVREMAAEDLGQIGADAVPELKKAAAGGNKKLSAAAAEVLNGIE